MTNINTPKNSSIIRLNLSNNFEERLERVIRDVQHTSYEIGAKMNQAPIITDCVTMIRYMVHRFTGESFPLMYIGDMPKSLVKSKFLESRITQLVNHKPGDLIFFYGTSKRHGGVDMVKHVGMMTDEYGNYIHSSQHTGGTISNINDNLIPIASEQQLLESKDPRSKKHTD